MEVFTVIYWRSTLSSLFCQVQHVCCMKTLFFGALGAGFHCLGDRLHPIIRVNKPTDILNFLPLSLLSLTLQRGVTSTACHSENITCRGVTSGARHGARSHSFDYISTT